VDTLTADLKRRAIDEGFDLVGVAEAAKARSAGNFEHWLDAGMHGEMGYMARTRRIRSDPRLLLPGCTSVVAVAMSYHCDQPDSTTLEADDGRVWVSRYAWGRDYHRILKKKLIRLGRWLAEQRPGVQWRACVDTAPILEREWAARAGLGWIGKNTLLLNRKLGSELFLGILLTDQQMVPDGPRPEHCGTCTACLDWLSDGGAPVRDSGRDSVWRRDDDRRLRHLSGGLSLDPARSGQSPPGVRS
jgi:epoxyqueuosine reductase